MLQVEPKSIKPLTCTSEEANNFSSFHRKGESGSFLRTVWPIGARGGHKCKRLDNGLAIIIAIVPGYSLEVIVGSKINLQNQMKNLKSELYIYITFFLY